MFECSTMIWCYLGYCIIVILVSAVGTNTGVHFKECDQTSQIVVYESYDTT